MIKEDSGVPVAARKISLLGMFSALISRKVWYYPSITHYINVIGASLSGKTTIFNHLQLLYGNGISIIEKLAAFEDIVRNLAYIFLVACDRPDQPLSHDKEVRSIIEKCPLLCYH